MKVLSGHLTQTEKKHIRAILNAGLMQGKINRKNYFIFFADGVYTVKIMQTDRGLIPVPGSKLRVSTYTNTFVL